MSLLEKILAAKENKSICEDCMYLIWPKKTYHSARLKIGLFCRIFRRQNAN
ncbi:MAG: hypothetical protein PHS93_08860 [Candidatus Omnitrophica bacterium]|nr:hypothetical protein [Candidatus Omnitrophota bacterium]